MTKQEEIREGLIEICRERTSGAGKVLAGEILDYLHSQGVVIKVDRELPDDVLIDFSSNMESAGKKFIDTEITYDAYVELTNKLALEADKKLTLAGYGAVESLVEK